MDKIGVRGATEFCKKESSLITVGYDSVEMLIVYQKDALKELLFLIIYDITDWLNRSIYSETKVEFLKFDYLFWGLCQTYRPY